jgi:hypothetical protein
MSLLVIAAAVVDETGTIRPQREKHNRSVMVAVYGTPWAIPRKQCITDTHGKSNNTFAGFISVFVVKL